MARNGSYRTLGLVWQAVRAILRAVLRGTLPAPERSTKPTTERPAGTTTQRLAGTTNVRPIRSTSAHRGYAGDAVGIPELRYAPFDDDVADPGEIVWAWVPYEEDRTRGKDRPVLVIGRQNGLLVALMLTSKDHDLDASDEARFGRHWVDIGVGAWDSQGRPSEVRVDRVLRLDPSAVRREGAALDRERFDRVAAGVRAAHAHTGHHRGGSS